MTWRLDKSLEKLRTQVNITYPNRSKLSDGTIGDTAHASTVSDHNPDANGVVRAMDITHDPVHGLDIQNLADGLRDSRDSRIKYIIANSRIFIPPNWSWQAYSGSNPHSKHMHISIKGNYDDTKNWSIISSMIPDLDNYYARYRKAMKYIRGRDMSRTEFRNNFVGNGHLTMLETMLDNSEASKWYAMGQLGLKASTDNWQDQIKTLLALTKALQGENTANVQRIGELEIANSLLDTDNNALRKLGTAQSQMIGDLETDNNTLRDKLASCTEAVASVPKPTTLWGLIKALFHIK